MIAAILYALGIVLVLFVLGFERRRKADRWVRVIPQQMADSTQETRRETRKQEERAISMPVPTAAGTLPNAMHR
jgi:hypothetical protein